MHWSVRSDRVDTVLADLQKPSASRLNHNMTPALCNPLIFLSAQLLHHKHGQWLDKFALQGHTFFFSVPATWPVINCTYWNINSPDGCVILHICCFYAVCVCVLVDPPGQTVTILTSSVRTEGQSSFSGGSDVRPDNVTSSKQPAPSIRADRNALGIQNQTFTSQTRRA